MTGIFGAFVHACSCHCVHGCFTVKHPCLGSGVLFIDRRQASRAAWSGCCAVAGCTRRHGKVSGYSRATNAAGGGEILYSWESWCPIGEIFQGKMDLHRRSERDSHRTWRNGYLAILVHQKANEWLSAASVSELDIVQSIFPSQAIFSLFFVRETAIRTLLNWHLVTNISRSIVFVANRRCRWPWPQRHRHCHRIAAIPRLRFKTGVLRSCHFARRTGGLRHRRLRYVVADHALHRKAWR